MKKKKLFSKTICMVLATATVMSFSVIPSFASEATSNVSSVDEKAYTPSSDSTWGDLYRYFDPEGFTSLTDEEKQLYNSTPLNNNNAVLNSVDTSISNPTLDFVTESGKTDYVSTSGTIYSNDEHSRALDLGISNFTLGVDSTEDSIGYTAAVLTTIRCPKLGIAITLYEKSSGKYVDFNSESEEDALFCSIDDRFDGLKSKTEYTVHALGMITPPENYVASPLYLEKDYKTK